MEEDHQVEQEQHRSEWTVGDRRLAILAFVIGLAIVITAVCGYAFGWEWTGLIKPELRTFWDWLKLLIVPTVLALGGYLFTRSENRRSQDVTDQRTREDRQIAQERVEADRQIADQRRQDDTLQAYLDQMGQLLLNRASHKEAESDKVRTLVRARTLTALKVLDAEHNRSVLQFLMESKLLNVSDFKGADLEGADLRGANLIGLDLGEANLRAANLSEAKLYEANLEEADLRDANLNNAELTGANLRSAKLEHADLQHAYLRDANLFTAYLRKAKLKHANLSGADMEGAEFGGADLSYADLRPTSLRAGETLENMSKTRWERSFSGRDIDYEKSLHNVLKAELADAKLAGASLKDADLRYSNLYEADLKDADLTGANLQGATARVRVVKADPLTEDPVDDQERAIRQDLDLWKEGSPRRRGPLVPIAQLQQSRSLRDATMPDGQKYEDWLKGREERGKM